MASAVPQLDQLDLPRGDAVEEELREMRSQDLPPLPPDTLEIPRT